MRVEPATELDPVGSGLLEHDCEVPSRGIIVDRLGFDLDCTEDAEVVQASLRAGDPPVAQQVAFDKGECTSYDGCSRAVQSADRQPFELDPGAFDNLVAEVDEVFRGTLAGAHTHRRIEVTELVECLVDPVPVGQHPGSPERSTGHRLEETE